jgi:hypothetical protein
MEDHTEDNARLLDGGIKGEIIDKQKKKGQMLLAPHFD